MLNIIQIIIFVGIPLLLGVLGYLYHKSNHQFIYLLGFGMLLFWLSLLVLIGGGNYLEKFIYSGFFCVGFTFFPLWQNKKQNEKVPRYQQILMLLSLLSFSMVGHLLMEVDAHLQNLLILSGLLLSYIISAIVFTKNKLRLATNRMEKILFLFIIGYLFLVLVYYIPLVWLEQYKVAYINLLGLTLGYFYCLMRKQKQKYFVPYLFHFFLLYGAFLFGNLFYTVPLWLNSVLLLGNVVQWCFLFLKKKNLLLNLKKFYQLLSILTLLHVGIYLFLIFHDIIKI